MYRSVKRKRPLKKFYGIGINSQLIDHYFQLVLFTGDIDGNLTTSWLNVSLSINNFSNIAVFSGS